jgi:2-polyprenyl-3-methyl-5-hydroxy-6-metoxy-1,4-benzoquinol methylase
VGDVDEAEFQAILDHDERHWWYRGRLRVVRQQVARLNLPPGACILDAGCGSGRVLDELAHFGQVAGVDASPVAVTAAHRRGHGDVSLARVEDLPFGDQSFHLVTCLDVIEHTPDDRRALRELLRVTRPGGYLLVTAPAYQSLWSAHDERNDHYRRYRRRGLREAAAAAGWQLVRDTHFNSLLLVPAAAVRLAGRMRHGGHQPIRSELSITPPPLAPLLELPLRLEAALLRRGVTLPAGLSVAAVFVRPERAARLRLVPRSQVAGRRASAQSAEAIRALGPRPATQP